MKEITPYRPEIRFSDVDAYGVVHNAKYIVYMEQARIHWWRQAMGEGTWDWSKVGVLVAHHTIDYVRPVRLGDVLEVSSHIGALGNKSMDVHYEMTCNGHPVARRPKPCLCASITKTQATIPVPERLAPSPRRVHRLNDPHGVRPRLQGVEGRHIGCLKRAVWLKFFDRDGAPSSQSSRLAQGKSRAFEAALTKVTMRTSSLFGANP